MKLDTIVELSDTLRQIEDHFNIIIEPQSKILTLVSLSLICDAYGYPAAGDEHKNEKVIIPINTGIGEIPFDFSRFRNYRQLNSGIIVSQRIAYFANEVGHEPFVPSKDMRLSLFYEE